MVKRQYWIGVIFVLILGTLMHYFYEWSGGNAFVGLFAPVNETMKQHLKLTFYPILLYRIILFFRLDARFIGYFLRTFAGAIISIVTMAVLYQIYTRFTRHSLLYVDIAIFVISTLVGLWVCYALDSFAKKRAV